MDLSTQEIIQCLQDLRLSQDTCDHCGRLAQNMQYEDLYLNLRGTRVQFLNEMHAAQERLDRLDRLIYDIKKKREDA